MSSEWISALIGGGLIGVAVSLMLLWNGRVTGISGIIYGLLNFTKGDAAWRLSFLLGLLGGGFALRLTHAESFEGFLNIPDSTVLIAGLFVGFGTVLGSGCTSGHGVCGISRLSIRSIVATVVFITAGILSVYFFKNMVTL